MFLDLPDDVNEVIQRAELLLDHEGILSVSEEMEIEEIIKQLRKNGLADEAIHLQKRYDEYYSWNYDNEDEL